jgi:hypothetical protein
LDAANPQIETALCGTLYKRGRGRDAPLHRGPTPRECRARGSPTEPGQFGCRPCRTHWPSHSHRTRTAASQSYSTLQKHAPVHSWQEGWRTAFAAASVRARASFAYLFPGAAGPRRRRRRRRKSAEIRRITQNTRASDTHITRAHLVSSVSYFYLSVRNTLFTESARAFHY